MEQAPDNVPDLTNIRYPAITSGSCITPHFSYLISSTRSGWKPTPCPHPEPHRRPAGQTQILPHPRRITAWAAHDLYAPARMVPSMVQMPEHPQLDLLMLDTGTLSERPTLIEGSDPVWRNTGAVTAIRIQRLSGGIASSVRCPMGDPFLPFTLSKTDLH